MMMVFMLDSKAVKKSFLTENLLIEPNKKAAEAALNDAVLYLSGFEVIDDKF